MRERKFQKLEVGVWTTPLYLPINLKKSVRYSVLLGYTGYCTLAKARSYIKSFFYHEKGMYL